MEHAKKMVLIDERQLDRMSWKRPPDQTAKRNLNREMHQELDNPLTPDDLKVKHYHQLLTRFLNTKRNLPDTVPPPPPQKKTKKRRSTSFTPRRRSKRQPKKVQWEEW